MDRHPHKSRWTRLSLLLLLVAAVGATLALSLLREARTRDQANELAQKAKRGQSVEVAQVGRSEPTQELLLVGETRPYYSVTLYARVSGYLKRLTVDIGDQVRQGQVLAEVESPEADLAYNSARADSVNKQRIAQRMGKLLKRRLVSPQEAEQAFSAAEIARANLEAQGVVRGYQQVLAPFDGRISQRFVDPGALIQNASASQSASQPLFTLSQTDRLRIFAYVDQRNAAYVHAGDAAEVSLPERPAERLQAKVERIAAELDPKTRTLLVEVALDNREGRIVPGSFVQVRLRVGAPSYLALPVQALVVRGAESFVALVGEGDQVRYQKIDLAENDGKQLLIRSGVREGDRAALNIGNSLRDGQKIQVAQKAPEPRGQAGQVDR